REDHHRVRHRRLQRDALDGGAGEGDRGGVQGRRWTAHALAVPAWFYDLPELIDVDDADGAGHAGHVVQRGDACRIGRNVLDVLAGLELDLEPADGFADLVDEAHFI